MRLRFSRVLTLCALYKFLYYYCYYYYFFAHWYFIPRGLEIKKV